jgi:eukaryotic-like serine/threonine-protein kinase
VSTEPGPSPLPEDREDPTRTFLIAGVAPGAEIGPYRLLRQLGEGGMGVVYHAHQVQPIRRDVALKIIKPGMDSKQIIARFEGERQALAVMDHPNIARVLDTGTTDKGLPYFVMELVEGIPINRYCDSKRLTIRQRLELFVPLCEAIQHAHQKGIIHRDIKPSNILVAEQEGRAVLKVIDFGLAKALGPQTNDATVLTNLWAVVGTLAYMSPEQAELTRHDIDTRTDVYSLGAMLYELLAGTTPLQHDSIVGRSYAETLQRIRQEENPLPSARLRRSSTSLEIAERRQIEPARLPKLLQRELDWIVMKAIEKERARRYSTPSELAADITRYLNDEPVLACPPSAVYRTRKFVRRHRFGVAIAIATAIPLLALAISIPIQGRRVLRERDKALTAEKTATQVSSFLIDLFKVADPTKTGGAITAREILDRGAQKVRTELDGQPLVKARLMETLGIVYDNIGLYDQALPLLETSLATRRKLLGEEDLDAAASLSAVGNLWYDKGEFAKARPMLDEVLRIREKLLGPDDLEVASSLHNLANTNFGLGNYTEAERLAGRALAIREKKLPPNDSHIVTSVNTLGAIAFRKGELTKARQLWERTLAMREATLPADHPFLAGAMNNLALIRNETGDAAGARVLLERVVAIQEKTLGPKHVDLAFSLNNLGDALMRSGDYAAALERYRRAVEILQATSPNHPELARFLSGVGWALLQTGQVEQARHAYQESFDLSQRTLGHDPVQLSRAIVGLAMCDQKEKRYQRSAELFERALALCRNRDGTYQRWASYFLKAYADLLRETGKAEKAREMHGLAESLQKQP